MMRGVDGSKVRRSGGGRTSRSGSIGLATVGLATVGLTTVGLATVGLATIGLATIGLATGCGDDGPGAMTEAGASSDTPTESSASTMSDSGPADDTAGPSPGSGSDDGPPADPCGAYVPGDDFSVCTATYLAGSGEDRVGGVAVAGDGTIYYAGSLPGEDLGTTPTSLMGGGDGIVLRLSADGRELLSSTRIGGRVSDIAVIPGSDRVAVVGDFGVAVLEDDATTLGWSDQPGDAGASAVAAAADGRVAVVHGTSLTLYDAAGASTASVGVGGSAVDDVVIDGPSGLTIVTGFKQDDGPPCTQLQIPFLRAYTEDGERAWTGYDWDREEVGAVSECADSRGIALAIGGDGWLYYAGESHGGNTVHRRLPSDLSTMATVVKTDMYNDPYDLNGAAPITFYARMDPATGAIDQGQFLVTRLSSNGKGNAARPRAIAADAEGHVFIAGATACCIENGAGKTVNGEPAMPEGYQGGGFVLVTSPDFGERLSWTTIRGQSGNGEAGVALASGVNVVAAFDQQIDEGSTADQPLLTFDAIQPSPGGGAADGYLVVWPRP